MSNGDKRSVSTDALETLGTIIDDSQGRDAIHLAVDPAVAGVKLYPGQDIAIVDGKAVPNGDPVGIVDPFLKAPVQPGQWFWLVVYPRQITSLRHVWSHPRFAEAETPAQRANKASSEQWLRDFCNNNDTPGYETVIAALKGEWPTKEMLESDTETKYGPYYRFENNGDHLYFGGTDAHAQIPREFWSHVEAVTGLRFEEGQRATFFSCSC